MDSRQNIVIMALAILLAGAAGAMAQSTPPLVNYQGKLLDSGGTPITNPTAPVEFLLWDKDVTTENVLNEDVMMGSTAAHALARQDLVPGSEVVTGPGGVPTYSTPNDYLIDYAAGTITRVLTGFILDGETVEVDYNWTSYGTLLWSESQFVNVNNGLYSTALGFINPLDSSLLTSATVFLEMAIDGSTLTPRQRLTSVPFALVADRLDGMDSTDFSLVGHTHDFSEITGILTDEQVPDNITIVYAADAGSLGGQPPEAYLSVSGNTVTGNLGIGQDLVVQGDASILGGNIGLGGLADSNYGIYNTAPGAPTYGALLSGGISGIKGMWGSDPTANYGILGSQDYGVWGSAGTSTTNADRYGGRFLASSATFAYGVTGTAYGYGLNSSVGIYGSADNDYSGLAYGLYGYGAKFSGSGDVWGVYGDAYNNSPDDSYGGYFSTSGAGTGTHYGVYGTADDYPVYAALSTDPADHYVYLASPSTGVYSWTGNQDETSGRFGGQFVAQSQSSTYGVYGVSYGYSAGASYGVYAYSENDGHGAANGTYSYAYASSSATAYGARAYAYNGSSGDTYGGKFDASTAGTGTHYGVRAATDDYPVYAEYSPDPADHYAYLASLLYGIYANNGASDETASRFGASLTATSQGYTYGVSSSANGWGTSSSYGAYNSAYNYSSGTAYGVYGYGGSVSGNDYGGYFYGASATSATSYGVYAWGGDYGLYVANGTKNWVNPDPEDATKSIAYVTVESGENLTYCRGFGLLVDGHAEITLPDHFRKVTNPDYPITVQVTPASSESLGLSVTYRSNSRIVVDELYHGTGNYRFDYTVQGMRLGYEDYEPIINNVDYVPFQGNLSDMDDSEITTQEFYDRQSLGLKRIFKSNGTLDKNGKVNETVFREKGWKEVKVKRTRK